MKKRAFMGIMLLIAAMVLSVGGTCFAQNTAKLENVAANSDQVWWPMVYSEATSADNTTGASAYVVTGTLLSADFNRAGTSVYAISNTRTNATNSEMLAVALTDGTYNLAGATPVGGPQLLSGTTTTLILYVTAPANHGVGGNAHTGATLFSIDGATGNQIWAQGIVFPNFGRSTGLPSILTQGLAYTTAPAANSPYCVAPVTIEWNSTTSAASIFGVSGTSPAAGSPAAGIASGVSVWNRNSGNGALTGDTQFAVTSGVSVCFTAPVISGESLFIVAPWNLQSRAGISIFQFDKDNLRATGAATHLGCAVASQNLSGPIAAANFLATESLNPTPCASGGSIFANNWRGGVSIYNAQNLAVSASLDLFGYNNSGVTAGPVTNGTRILIPFTSSVSCYEITNLTGNSTAWVADYAKVGFNPTGAYRDPAVPYRYQIWANPVISNNYVWVTVRDTVTNQAEIYRHFFGSNRQYGEGVQVGTRGDIIGDPLVVGTNLWFCTYNPTVERLSQSGTADGETYWAQYKADEQKRGNNTREALVEAPTTTSVPGSSGGCFISTIK